MKQEYKKPQVVKVNLKVQQTVLAGCKVAVSFGPSEIGCSPLNQSCPDTSQPS